MALLLFSELIFKCYTVHCPKLCRLCDPLFRRHTSTGGSGGGVIASHHKSNTRHIYVALAEGSEALVSDQRGEYHTWIQLTTITTLGTSHHTLYLAYIFLFYLFLITFIKCFLLFFSFFFCIDAKQDY